MKGKKMFLFKRKPQIKMSNVVSDDNAKLLRYIEMLPLGVSLRRVKPKSGGSQWAANHVSSKQDYYGATMLEAVENLIKTNKVMHEEFDPVMIAFARGDK